MINDKTNNGLKLWVLFGVVASFTACANDIANSASRTADVTIDYVGNCPAGASPNPITNLKPGDKIKFTASDLSKNFTLTFDPFVGKKYTSKDGTLTTRRLSKYSLPGDKETKDKDIIFKYSIHAENCDSIDPKVIVTR